MSFEENLVQVLRTQCPRVSPLTAPNGTQRPYVVYQTIGGGQTRRLLNGTPIGKRQIRVQVSVWGDRYADVVQQLRRIEDAMEGATAFRAKAEGEPMDGQEEVTGRFSRSQDFLIKTDL